MPHQGPAPEAGHSYPVRLGESFLDEGEQHHSYCSLRYDFKPASAGRFRLGAVEVVPDEGRVMVQLPDAANPSADVTFSGRYEATRDGLDCVAVFDGSEWRLELVQGLVKTLKTDSRRPSQPGRAGAQQVQPQTGAAEDDGGDVAHELEAALEEGDTPAADRSASPSPDADTAPRDTEETASPSAAGEPVASSRPPAAPAQPQQAAVHQSASPPPRAPLMRTEDVPEWEKAFYQAPSDASDDEDLNRCSDDDSDIGREHF